MGEPWGSPTPIGTARFELATFRSQSGRATRLRYVPLVRVYGGHVL